MNDEGVIYHDDSEDGAPDEDVQRLREHFERIAGDLDGELEKIHKERMADLEKIEQRLREHEHGREEGVTVTIHEDPPEGGEE